MILEYNDYGPYSAVRTVCVAPHFSLTETEIDETETDTDQRFSPSCEEKKLDPSKSSILRGRLPPAAYTYVYSLGTCTGQ